MKKTAFISIVGRPNVGKSTLVNSLVGEKISIVSSKPQTTRNRITGILTQGENQFVFLDTPGVHKAKNKLGEYMMKSVRSSVVSSDAAFLMADASHDPGDIEINIINSLKEQQMPAILILNKIDLTNAETLAKTIDKYSSLYDFDAFVPISAINGKNTDIVLEESKKYLYESDWLFEGDISTSQPERQIVAEIIREKLLRSLNEEIPHGTAVIVETFEESKNLIKIGAVIYCEKASHKSIIIGKNGSLIKKIGTSARQDLETFFGVKFYLDLWVKVKENWRDNDLILNSVGYNKKDFD